MEGKLCSFTKKGMNESHGSCESQFMLKGQSPTLIYRMILEDMKRSYSNISTSPPLIINDHKNTSFVSPRIIMITKAKSE